MSQLPTHADIAAAAGVSRATVSRALTNPHLVNEATQKKILSVAEKLGYRPDPFVTANMQRVRSSGKIRTKAILAYLIPRSLPRYVKDVNSYKDHYDSAQQKAHELGFELDTISMEEEKLSAKRCSEIMIARGIQGVVIGPFDNPFIRLHLDWSRFAVATIGFAHVRPRFSIATTNHYQIMSLAIRRLRHLGYHRIGMSMPSRADRYTQGMFGAAYCQYADAQPMGERIPRHVLELKDWGKEAFMNWFRRYQPEAILHITNDERRWIAEEGIRVPEDVGIVKLGWDAPVDLGYAGVNQHNELVGSAAVQLVVDALHLNERGAPAYPKSILIDGEWVSGNSVRCIRR